MRFRERYSPSRRKASTPTLVDVTPPLRMVSAVTFVQQASDEPGWCSASSPKITPAH
jgi:hypothetical protein